ncbi:MAG: 50S ribosomal protein L22 [Acidimicrobiales bacterium]|jgi:large subunit ribosomal protein L22
MPGLKTNERPGTRAVLRHSRMSAYKAREVLDLIRGVDYVRASEILESAERGAAEVIEKLLNSAAANALHNDQLDPEELYVSACFADEGTTLKRWRPRARGRATRIRKRTCHITVILSRLPDEEIAKRRARVVAEQAERRQRRVAGTRRARRQGADTAAEIAAADAAAQAEAIEAATEAAIDSANEDETEADETEAGDTSASAAEEETAASSDDTSADDSTEVEASTDETPDATEADTATDETPDEESE